MKTSRRNAIASSLKAATVAIVAAPGKLLASIAPGPRPDAPAVIADLVGRFKSPWSAVEYLASGLGCEAEGDDDVSPEECRRLGIYYDDLGNEARARLFEDRGDHAAVARSAKATSSTRPNASRPRVCPPPSVKPDAEKAGFRSPGRRR